MTDPSDNFELPDWAEGIPDWAAELPEDPQWVAGAPEWAVETTEEIPSPLPAREEMITGMEDSIVLPEPIASPVETTIAPEVSSIEAPDFDPALESVSKPALDLSFLESLLPTDPGLAPVVSELPKGPQSDVDTVFLNYVSKTVLPKPVVEPVKTEPLGFEFVYGAVIDFASRLAARSLRVEHEIPPGVVVVATNPPAEQSRKKLVWRLKGVPAGQTLPLRVTVRTTDPTWRPDRNIASFRATFSCRGAVHVPVSRPAVEASIVGPAEVEVGSTALFQLHVRNTGNWPIRDAVVSLATSPEFRRVITESIALEDLPVNESVTLEVPVEAFAAGRGHVRVAVQLPEGRPASAEAKCHATEAALQVKFVEPDRWRVNHAHPLVVVVSNPGTAAARDLRVLLDLPPCCDAVSDDFLIDGSCGLAETGRLKPGEERRLEIQIRPSNVGPASFHVQADAAGLSAVSKLETVIRIDAADSDSILERFVREAGFPPPDQLALLSTVVPASPRTRDDSHVVFELAGTSYALPLGSVREVCRPPAITPIPGAPEWLAGVANVRGDVVSMVDLRTFLGEPAAAATSERRLLIVAAPGSDMTAGLLVDRVRGLRPIPAASVADPAAPLSARAADYMRGVTQSAGTPLVVLAPDRLLLSPELHPFGPA